MFQLEPAVITAIKPLPGYEGLYAVSHDGRVRSMRRVIVRSNGVRMTVRARWLKPILRDDGYHVVTLHIGDAQRKLLVHHAVAAAWLPPAAPDQVEINHRDAVKTNNAASNIEWCTRAENVQHAVAHGLVNYRTPARKAASARLGRTKRKLSDDQIETIRARLNDGASLTSMAKQFRVAWLTIARINRGETYRSASSV